MDTSSAGQRIRDALGRDGRLTVLTGAGVSAESGVPTFRDLGGLWQRYRIEDVASPEAFTRSPELVYDFYNVRRRALDAVRPNPGHDALVRLEAALGERFMLITQNVDDLHERAGSRRLLHMHGELRKARCLACAAVVAWVDDLDATDPCPTCQGRMRPHIVWFGEVPFHLDDAIPRALEAEVFMSVGTSGVVYPAAGFVHAVKSRGGLCVEVNPEPSENRHMFDVQLRGRSGEVLPALLELIS